MACAIPETMVLSDAEAAEALKKFVKKNRKADRNKFVSTPNPVLTPATWPS